MLFDDHVDELATAFIDQMTGGPPDRCFLGVTVFRVQCSGCITLANNLHILPKYKKLSQYERSYDERGIGCEITLPTRSILTNAEFQEIIRDHACRILVFLEQSMINEIHLRFDK